jgi:hypothetical protein
LTIEVTGASGDEVTLKTTQTYGRTVDTKTKTVQKAQTPFPFAAVIPDFKGSYADPKGSDRTISQESVTVGAGTFAATKVAFSRNLGSGSKAAADTWLTDTLIPLKQTSTSSGGGFTATTSAELIAVQ